MRRVKKYSEREIFENFEINSIDLNKYMKALFDIEEEDEEANRISRQMKPPKMYLKNTRKFHCKGYFCSYEISDKVENCFKVKKEIQLDMKEAEKGGVKLLEHRKDRYSVTVALLEKIGGNLEIIDKVLNIFNIVNPGNKALKKRDLITKEEKN